MQTENDTTKPEDSPKQEAGDGCSGATCSADWNTLDDEFEEIMDGRWAVIRTADGWEIECQHSQSTYPLNSTNMESAKIEGEKLATSIENQHLYCQCANPGPHFHPGSRGKFCAVCGKDILPNVSVQPPAGNASETSTPR